MPRTCCQLPPLTAGILSVVGGVLLHLTLGTIYTFGNMTPYVTSYIRAYASPPDLNYQESIWIFALALMGQGLTMFIGGSINAKLGPRITALLGCWTLSLGIFLTYLTIKHSFVWCILTYGALFGVGCGIAYAIPISCGMEWLPNHKGLVSGIVVAGFGGGAFIFDQIQTAYINPENKAPDFDDHGAKYFSPEKASDVLSRVPNCFLLLGGSYAAMQLIGCLLLSYPKKDEVADEDGEVEQQHLLSSEDEQGDIQQSDSISFVQEAARAASSEVVDVHPMKVLRTRAFYTLWATFLVNGQGVVFISTLYKAYGQTFISDDQFLATLGAVASIFNAVGRIFWGHMADRFSYRTVMMCLCCSMIFFMMTLVATPKGGKAMFFIWICALFFTFSGNFALFPNATAKSFGQKYMPINFGLVFTSQVITGPIGAILASTLSDVIGWFGMFCVVSAFTLVGLILTFTFNVKKADGKDI